MCVLRVIFTVDLSQLHCQSVCQFKYVTVLAGGFSGPCPLALHAQPLVLTLDTGD